MLKPIYLLISGYVEMFFVDRQPTYLLVDTQREIALMREILCRYYNIDQQARPDDITDLNIDRCIINEAKARAIPFEELVKDIINDVVFDYSLPITKLQK